MLALGDHVSWTYGRGTGHPWQIVELCEGVCCMRAELYAWITCMDIQ